MNLKNKVGSLFTGELDLRAAEPEPHRAPAEQLLRSEPQVKVNCDLYRLARFGANISDAHSCFIFLPSDLLAELACSPGTDSEASRTLVLAGYHSLSTEIVQDCRLQRGAGLIGWVAKHGRSIHVSPFELDARTLGIYGNDQQLKSFLGIPVRLEERNGKKAAFGVIACDSKKSFAFSKLQSKLLEDLASEVSNTIALLLLYSAQGQSDIAWQTFQRRSEELASALGPQSIEVLRLKPLNFAKLETGIGTAGCLALMEQFYRLIQQALPPHFPVTRLINGDIVVCLDIMMSSFYENKFRAICDHIAQAGRRPQFEFIRASVKDRRTKVSVESLVAQTANLPGRAEGGVVRLEKEIANEYRRA